MFTFLIINQNTITCPVSEITFLFKHHQPSANIYNHLSYNYYSQSNQFPINKIKPVQHFSPLKKGHKEVKWVANTTSREK